MANFGRLEELLTAQLAVVKELQQTLQDEQKAIADLDTGRMESFNVQKELLVKQQQKIVTELKIVMAETARQLALPAASRLSVLIDKLPADARQKLGPLHQDLTETGSQVAYLADQNRFMLERFLGVVNDSLGYIMQILGTSNTYGARGNYLANLQAGAVMVSKEA